MNLKYILKCIWGGVGGPKKNTPSLLRTKTPLPELRD